MDTKICSKCGIEKSINEYNKNGQQGRRPECKACRSQIVKQRPKTHEQIAAGREASKRYARSAHGRSHIKEYLSANRERRRAWEREYFKRAARREKHREYRRKIYLADATERQKNKIRKITHSAVKSGIIPPVSELTCRHCSRQADHYHHLLYEPEHALDVVPVCSVCHKAIHMKLRLVS